VLMRSRPHSLHMLMHRKQLQNHRELRQHAWNMRPWAESLPYSSGSLWLPVALLAASIVFVCSSVVQLQAAMPSPPFRFYASASTKSTSADRTEL
jgi:hypothetical protein